MTSYFDLFGYSFIGQSDVIFDRPFKYHRGGCHNAALIPGKAEWTRVAMFKYHPCFISSPNVLTTNTKYSRRFLESACLYYLLTSSSEVIWGGRVHLNLASQMKYFPNPWNPFISHVHLVKNQPTDNIWKGDDLSKRTWKVSGQPFFSSRS